MDTVETRQERDRAHARFERIIAVHKAALNALQLAASLPEAADTMAMLFRFRKGMLPGQSDRAEELGAESMKAAQVELADGFATMRGLTLIAACGALEYLAKATFVDLAATDPATAALRIRDFKLKLPAADVLGLEPIEQWHRIADALLSKLAEPDPRMDERLRRFLLNCAPNPFGEEDHAHLNSGLKAHERCLLDEAFLVRNCLVHGGGKVSSTLAHFLGPKAVTGELIALDRAHAADMIAAVQRCAGVVNGLGRGYL